jgi:hypothetical protein
METGAAPSPSSSSGNYLAFPHGMFLINSFLVICEGHRGHRALSVQERFRTVPRPFYRSLRSLRSITVVAIHRRLDWVTICSITNVVIMSPTSACTPATSPTISAYAICPQNLGLPEQPDSLRKLFDSPKRGIIGQLLRFLEEMRVCAKPQTT